MSQALLFPDPRPLIDRLGADFFRLAPECAGVYLMRDQAQAVVYVGKAKNLRQRLASYRVANPDRLSRRHLRLLRAVCTIELEQCASEAAALARESELLRCLRPKFNRAGTWPAKPRFLAWNAQPAELQLAVFSAPDPGWRNCGSLGAGAIHLRAALARLIWWALHPQRGPGSLPHGWFSGIAAEVASIPLHQGPSGVSVELDRQLNSLCAGDADPFLSWLREQTAAQTHPFAVAARETDLELVTEFAKRRGATSASHEPIPALFPSA